MLTLKKILAASLLSFMLLAGCNDQSSSDQTFFDADDDATQQSGNPVYVVATDPSFAPFEFRDDKGLVTGFDYDLLTAVGEAAGFDVKFIPTQWNGIFEKLNEDIDIIASGVAITEDRKQLADFSDPYLETYGVAITSVHNPYLKEFTQLKEAKITAQQGNYNLKFIESLSPGILDDVEMQKTVYQAFAAVATGKADATVGNVHAFRYMAKLHDVKINEIEIPNAGSNSMGFAVAKGDREILNQINQGLRTIKNNGVYQDIIEKWFGSSE